LYGASRFDLVGLVRKAAPCWNDALRSVLLSSPGVSLLEQSLRLGCVVVDKESARLRAYLPLDILESPLMEREGDLSTCGAASAGSSTPSPHNRARGF
jgi:hypothetical protein